MSDIIHLLPDSIANQIAAGEVIQRPASVVKELVENALDAGATSIQLVIKDAGRTLVQVIDNGKGMSATDARLAFERHATSKINKADDLFALRTMGFRGEALASIAAIAQVELRTKREEDETGTLLRIAGSQIEAQECISCPEGSNFSVKNIFYNVPARRRFLKSNETEKRHIMTELERIALVNPQIEFSYVENDIEIAHYPVSNLRQRIVNVEGKSLNQQLIAVNIDTSLVKIAGFVSKPEAARKTRPLQNFFVNNRYMRHPYFAKAVANAYSQLVQDGAQPNYFIYFDVDPATIDVNIHPTKTEIKFENEKPIWQILYAAVKEALGKFNAVPSIDFDMQDAVNIPIHDPMHINRPTVDINPSYNPFKAHGSGRNYTRPSFDWEKLYEGFGKSDFAEEAPAEVGLSEGLVFGSSGSADDNNSERLTSQDMIIHYQYKNKYILTSVKSGLMLIDQHRAHVRILFDQFLKRIEDKKGVSQRTLFPEIVELSPSESVMIPYLMEDLESIGFDLGSLGNNAYSINGIPSEVMHKDASAMLRDILDCCIETGSDVKDEIRQSLALSMANAAAIPYGQKLSEDEMLKIVGQLFESPLHKYTPDGKTVISLLEDSALDRLFS